MSDYIFVDKTVKQGYLSKQLLSIYSDNKPQVKEYHGNWGSLAVTKNKYQGFDSYETEKYIIVVIGGPILEYRDNKYLVGSDSTIGTISILNKWVSEDINWDRDLNGPFNILIIDKIEIEVVCVTDLMLFIPAYIFKTSQGISVSTHIDVLAKTVKKENEIDLVSASDFIIHNVITYPYTFYKEIYQLQPSSVFKYNKRISLDDTYSYWMPEESNSIVNINKASQRLRNGVEKYINSIVSGMSNVAHFISAGEDSRVIAGMLPKHVDRKACIFLDHMNREGLIAKKISDKYGSEFHHVIRDKLHYLNILESSSKMVGIGHQYFHGNSVGLSEKCGLGNSPAVFGGFLADSILKGTGTKKWTIQKNYPFIPEFELPGITRTEKTANQAFSSNVLTEIDKRRKNHFNKINSFRKKSTEEWFLLWPMTMRSSIPNLYANRRLFNSYEPFMSNECVKVAAEVPTNWKLNRKLFRKAFKPYLKLTRWYQHADGRLPYYSWKINTFIQFSVWFARGIGKKLGIVKGNQGPWCDWHYIQNTEDWALLFRRYESGFEKIKNVTTIKDIKEIPNNRHLTVQQRINYLQVISHLTAEDVEV